MEARRNSLTDAVQALADRRSEQAAELARLRAEVLLLRCALASTDPAWRAQLIQCAREVS